MHTYDIIVAVHHALKAPSRDTYGPESVGLYGTAAGVSLLSTRPEGPNLANLLPEGWGIYNELRSEEPWRKIVKIVLPEDVEGGDYLIANVTINGLHSTRYSAHGIITVPVPSIGRKSRTAMINARNTAYSILMTRNPTNRMIPTIPMILNCARKYPPNA